MLNQFVCVGRLMNKPNLKETEEGKKYSEISICVPRNYKNSDGKYDKDYIDCVVYGNIAENMINYCDEGDMIGVKGRIQGRFINDDTYVMELVAEKVSFLSKGDVK